MTCSALMGTQLLVVNVSYKLSSLAVVQPLAIHWSSYGSHSHTLSTAIHPSSTTPLARHCRTPNGTVTL